MLLLTPIFTPGNMIFTSTKPPLQIFYLFFKLKVNKENTGVNISARKTIWKKPILPYIRLMLTVNFIWAVFTIRGNKSSLAKKEYPDKVNL